MKNNRASGAMRWPAGIPGALFLTFAALIISLALTIALVGRERFLNRLRYVNKRFLNPAVLPFAGRPRSPWAIVRHMGRRSGRVYSTPVVADATGDNFVIPLPYNPNADWCRNVLAAGGCILQWKGSEYAAVEPQVIDAATALPLLAPQRQPLWRAMKIKQFLKLRRSATLAQAAPPEAEKPIAQAVSS
jgi:hypothetical protein